MDAQGSLEVPLRQLSRIFGYAIASTEEASLAVDRDPSRLAHAFFAEAADSDDVTGIAGARAYLEERLAYFQRIIAAPAADRIRAEFETLVRAWEA